jgi:hypothetical protein
MDGCGVADGDAYDNVGKYLDDNTLMITESLRFGFGN